MKIMGIDLGVATLDVKAMLGHLFLEMVMGKGIYPRPSATERFWAKVTKSDGCWVWSGSFLKDGYGNFNENRKSIPAHRFSYKEFVGPIPDGMVVRHRCDNPACVRPEHLELGTQKENIHDAVLRGRHVRGASHGMSNITELQASKVKKLLSAGLPMAKVSRILKVGYYTVRDIKEGRSWSWV